jgi:hypothetical protein
VKRLSAIEIAEGALLADIAVILFWGLALSRRWPHLSTLALGTLGLSVGTATLTLFVVALFVPLADLIKSYQRSYAFALSAADFVTSHVGLGEVWHRSVYPTADAIGTTLLAHWWLMLIIGSVLFAWPFVLTTYTLTNVLVRLLGYEVAPFPGGRVDRLGKRIAWRLLRVAIRRGLVGRGAGA